MKQWILCLFVLYLAAPIKCSDETNNYITNLQTEIDKLDASLQSSSSKTCEKCKILASNVITYRRGGASTELTRNFLINICKLFIKWEDDVCNGVVNMSIDTIVFIIDNKENVTAEHFCGIKYQDSGCLSADTVNWNLTIPPRNENYAKKISSKNSSKHILHLTDIHYDPEYEPGSNADCGKPLCCELENGSPKNSNNSAGYWGDYHVCDMPWHSVLDLLNHVSLSHKNIDYVYYTGDIVSHKSWDTSRDYNTQSIRKVLDQFKQVFKSIPVYPILGNHEAHPTNFYSAANVMDKKLSTQWVFDLAADEWSKWLPRSTIPTIRKGGYYTVLVEPGFRIIALNSNAAYIHNLWLMYNEVDTYGQLQWLVDTLLKAERNGESVHILSHVPPGDLTSFRQWNDIYIKIVERFADVITAQFNGHTHIDELRLFYNSSNPGQVINAAYNGGSFTTFVANNPNYRIYELDDYNFVLDYDEWSFDLQQANARSNKKPEWFKLYSFKEAYKMTDLKYESFADLIQRMIVNNTLVEQYYKFGVRNSEVALREECNSTCLQEKLCSITAVNFENSLRCIHLS